MFESVKKLQISYSAAISRGSCCSGESSLNRANQAHGATLIKTMACSIADGTSHQTVCSLPTSYDNFSHQRWLMAVITATLLSTLFVSSVLLSVCGNLFSSLVDRVQLMFEWNTEEQASSVLEEVISCVLISSPTLCLTVNWTASWKVGMQVCLLQWVHFHSRHTANGGFMQWPAAAPTSSVWEPFGSAVTHTHAHTQLQI